MKPIMKEVVIHCKPAVLNTQPIKDNDLYWNYSKQFGQDEIDIFVNDIPYEVQDGIYHDPDELLCEHYNIPYDLVNCIEAI